MTASAAAPGTGVITASRAGAAPGMPAGEGGLGGLGGGGGFLQGLSGGSGSPRGSFAEMAGSVDYDNGGNGLDTIGHRQPGPGYGGDLYGAGGGNGGSVKLAGGINPTGGQAIFL